MILSDRVDLTPSPSPLPRPQPVEETERIGDLRVIYRVLRRADGSVAYRVPVAVADTRGLALSS
jgi:hypothetical protein